MRFLNLLFYMALYPIVPDSRHKTYFLTILQSCVRTNHPWSRFLFLPIWGFNNSASPDWLHYYSSYISFIFYTIWGFNNSASFDWLILLLISHKIPFLAHLRIPQQRKLWLIDIITHLTYDSFSAPSEDSTTAQGPNWLILLLISHKINFYPIGGFNNSASPDW